jgi:hypothetical protein
MTNKLVKEIVEDFVFTRAHGTETTVNATQEDLLLLAAQIYGLGQGRSGEIEIPDQAKLAEAIGWWKSERSLSDETVIDYVIKEVVKANQ